VTTARFPTISIPAFLAAGAVLLVQGCAPPAPTGPGPRYFAIDLSGGAKSCTVPPSVDLAAGKTNPVAMTVTNDGGWCGILVSQPGPKPFDVGLLTQRPAHGSVYVHVVGNQTRVDYTPNRAFKGADSFTVKLMPGAAEMKVAVTVD